MITDHEVRSALRGCWRLARLDARGLEDFDDSVEGFWRSFWAFAILSPAYIAMFALEYGQLEIAVDAPRFYAVHAIGLVIAIAGFPLAMYYLSRLMDRERHYTGYIVAYNWSHILQMIVVLPAVLMAPSAAEAEAAAGASPALLFLALVYIVVLLYVGYIAKVALDITAFMAASVVALDMAISIMIDSVSDAIILTG